LRVCVSDWPAMETIAKGSASEDQSVCPFGPELQRYWDRRHEYFSRFDEGVMIDREGLYSVTPESIAEEIAKRIGGAIVLDGFAGTGANAIAFARHAKHVVSVELDADRLAIAKHNSVVYGVSKRIDFVHGDIMKLLPSVDAESAFFDPPWGGPGYANKDTFALDAFAPDGRDLLSKAFDHVPAVALKVPRNFAFDELFEFDRRARIHEEKMNGRHLFSTVHFLAT